jgi:hypothetical protein
VRAYCQRYGVAAGPDGLPPFPTGRRETPQHRQWLTLYKGRQRLGQRTAAESARSANDESAPRGPCPVCARDVRAPEAVRHRAPSRAGLAWRVHRTCAELLRAAQEAGPEACARAVALLWPKKA